MINVFHPWFNCMILRVPQKLGGKRIEEREEKEKERKKAKRKRRIDMLPRKKLPHWFCP